MKQTIIILIIIAIIVIGFVVVRNTESPSADNNPLQYQGTIEDITEDGNAFGKVLFEFESGTSFLEGSFNNLPDPGRGWYYEGWVVRRNPFEFISVGRIAQEGDVYVLRYQGDVDLSDYTFFTLTHEFDDINPGPSRHILEGTLERLSQ